MSGTHPLIIAHRGASASAPENTLEAFRTAVAQDADGIELDVRRTADGVIVVNHDPEIEGLGPVVGATFDRLREAAPWVATLDEALMVTGDLLLDIEVKNHPSEPDHDPDQATARAVAGWAARLGLEWRVVVTSFDPGALAAAKAEAPSVPTGFLVGPSATFDSAMALAVDAGHRWFLPHWSTLVGDASAVVAEAHRRELAVITWTVDDHEVMRRLASQGIDGIVTNDPAAAVDVLAG
jgi:glycerophosphoryl diester phosphodiesterase